MRDEDGFLPDEFSELLKEPAGYIKSTFYKFFKKGMAPAKRPFQKKTQKTLDRDVVNDITT
jgi:hypothetical protein